MDQIVNYTRLADLIYEGEFSEAIDLAENLSVHKVYSIIFDDDKRWTDSGKACDEFIRRWFREIKDPYRRAELGYSMPSAYTVQMAEVENAEYIGAHMFTSSLRDVIYSLADQLSENTVSWVRETPEKPLTEEDARRWIAVGKILAELDLPQPVDPFDPKRH